MPATRDGKLWRSQFYYKDWQGVRRKKNKRGFKTKGEADEWERNFLQQQQKNLDISFENFVEIYFADMENRLRESTIINKRYVFDLKVTPYFKHKKMCEIQTSDIRAWQNELIKKGYAPTYLKVLTISWQRFLIMLYAIMICVIILAEKQEVSERARLMKWIFGQNRSSKSSCHLWIVSLKQEWHSCSYIGLV
mgnify:CR=1 FL=1